jgi:predicted Zn-dependent peptidase
LAFAYHVPPRNTPEYYAMGLLDQLLLQGDDSLLHQELVKKRGYTNKVEGGINSGLGNMYNYSGPMLWTAELIHDPGVSPDQIMTAVNTVMASVRDKPLDQKMLDRALVKLRSDLYSTIAEMAGLGKLDLLASFALFDDNPARINTLEDEFRKVTPAIAQKTAREYFRDTNRTVLIAVPPQAKAAPGGNQ